MGYSYEDEDNVPMCEELFDRIDHYGHNPTVYSSWSEMKAIEKELPFTDPPERNCCGNCDHWDGDYCTKLWNNLDDSYKDEDRDKRRPEEVCDDWSGEYGFELDP